MGRPRKYASNAERQRAYRDRHRTAPSRTSLTVAQAAKVMGASTRTFSRLERISREAPEAMFLVEHRGVAAADAESLVGQDARVRRLAVDLVANGKYKRLRNALASMAPTEDVESGSSRDEPQD